ncbi:hypothetical protein EUGRSUZ_B00218 [Eucalyptus grandis]|uniref:Uncharacterized protein n=2 Tax=Eucalyptus grandis TaxID=71139 RepID=A0ACC3LNH0_EUCGR|nr:hypothetical protein EUGRSUZ_B00218 [Eucalyptus grandis]
MLMKKQQQPEKHEPEHELEILKAVAQAWHSHSSGSRVATSSEFDTRRLNFKSRPSRFKMEAISGKSVVPSKGKGSLSGGPWDFRESLWDSYEIVTVAKKLEAKLNLDDPFGELPGPGKVIRRKRESMNSLRNLFNLMSSRRYNEPDAPSPSLLDNQF